MIQPRHDPPIPTDSDNERILAEVYGSKAPSSDSIESLTVAETAHPNSTSYKIREVTKLLASSTVHGSETSNSDSPSPTKSSPVKERRKSKRKGVPEKVVVDAGDEPTESTQPEKKRRSAYSQKAKSDPPARQVFKTLRSSVKSKVPMVFPSTTSRKMKVASKPRGMSVTPDVQNVPTVVPESPDTSVYKPQFVSETAQDKWSTMTVTSICSFSKLLTYEFYFNLNEEIENLTSEKCQQIFIRGKWHVFGPDMINQYYGLKTVEEEEISYWDLVAKTLTGGLVPVWPTGDNDTLFSSQFTSKFVMLHRISLHNWLPSAHFHTVGKILAALLFRVGTKMTIDLGRWIFYHILTLIHPMEQKVRLPYPNLIFGVLTSQGLIPMPSEIIAPTLLYIVDPRLLTGKHIRDVTHVDAPHTSETDTAVEDTPYARDVQLSLRLKARVSELENVSNIISNQLNAAHTELPTILLRMSLSKSAAGDNVKTDSEGPFHA
ncbi:PREDICTED: uncharacterized protein LOC109150721 [Ipomoea nil]|uniref:uncharacterized protein LOC109150721 n=1 Tax=Ipomoea nil TaxID=35883 RepID=UPI00090163E5|nr:PREDICTED: uncharacterized protein LOC109150721 [Ipomoea nil]